MEYIWLFILLFAVLAAAWFYLQRAKARPTSTVTTVDSAAPVASEPATDATDERPAS